MSDEGVPAVRRHAAMIVTGAIGLFVLLLVLRGIGGMMADRKRAEVLRAWSGTLGSFEEIFEQYPARDANETALRIEELGAALGIDIAPERLEGRPRPTEATARAYKGTRIAVGRYLEEHFESGGPAAVTPPAAFVAFLRKHEVTLARLKESLENGALPRWQLRLEEPFAEAIPNLRGHVDLQRLLLADALIRDDTGDIPGALSALEASWRLNAALRDEPMALSQYSALNVARIQLGTLRHLERLPPVWQERIYEHDYRQSILTALRYDGWTWMKWSDPAAHSIADPPWSRMILRVAGPYVGYCAADVSDSWRQRLILFSKAASICDSAPEEAGLGADLEVASWNKVGGQWLPGLGELARRMARYEVDREMTAKLLEIRAAYDARDSFWPESLPGIEASAACPDDHWRYTVSPSGGMSLTLSRPLDWGDLAGTSLATRYAVPPPAAGDGP